MSILNSIKKSAIVQSFLYNRYWRRLIAKGKVVPPPQKTDVPIDFVVLWVDDTDPVWQADRKKHEALHIGSQGNKSNNDARFRDWNIFRYWFRAVEKYAPWVRNVYLVTCGHVPSWLNLDAPRLKLISHKDIIPEENLPTFNSGAIETCIHNIPGLSELFVFFNDDVFLCRPTLPEDFFTGNLPNYSAVALPTICISNSAFDHKRFAAIGAINHKFKHKIKEKIVASPEKWFSPHYGNLLEFNVFAAQRDILPGMFFPHLAVPFRKSTFKKAWKEFPNLLESNVIHRFRHPQDVSHQLISLLDIMEGNFYPVPCEHHGKGFWRPETELKNIHDAIVSEKFLCICINDSEFISREEYMKAKEHIKNSFDVVFPNKSSFEK